ncbi:MAG: helix-turn-helix transcriptional regulator [Clostridia bacterium]|nr:helix-turn-helix transcriptional regulator [Clostridia bacterium]
MILADKIVQLRKKNGWSQEELAAQLNVSRQAVSKWEGAQSVPDLDRILQMSALFGVTTDYLLKDEMEVEQPASGKDSELRRVRLDEANAYLAWRERASLRIAVATFLCILSPIPLLMLSAASQVEGWGISENQAAIAGLIVLLLAVAAAVALFIACGSRNAPYEFLEKEAFETEYGVEGMVRERQRAFRSSYARGNILGTCLCILAPVALLVGAFSRDDFLTVAMLCVTLLIVGVGVMIFISVGVRWAAMQRLLQEGEFSAVERGANRFKEAVGVAYWLVATAVYLA